MSFWDYWTLSGFAVSFFGAGLWLGGLIWKRLIGKYKVLTDEMLENLQSAYKLNTQLITMLRQRGADIDYLLASGEKSDEPRQTH